jgi:hypothetical protein
MEDSQQARRPGLIRLSFLVGNLEHGQLRIGHSKSAGIPFINSSSSSLFKRV